MSWDKNTFIYSNIDSAVRILKHLSEKYTVTYLGEVKAMGLNDDYCNPPKETYPIRKLEYRDKVILERMERTHDCDSDDVLTSSTFNKGEEPKEWPLEVYSDCEDFTCTCVKDGISCCCYFDRENEKDTFLEEETRRLSGRPAVRGGTTSVTYGSVLDDPELFPKDEEE